MGIGKFERALKPVLTKRLVCTWEFLAVCLGRAVFLWAWRIAETTDRRQELRLASNPQPQNERNPNIINKSPLIG